MIVNTQYDAGRLGAKELCRPDPEEMLQHARKQKEECDRAIELLQELNSLSVYVDFGGNGDRNALQYAYGSIFMSKMEAEQNEQFWLTEIDK